MASQRPEDSTSPLQETGQAFHSGKGRWKLQDAQGDRAPPLALWVWEKPGNQATGKFPCKCGASAGAIIQGPRLLIYAFWRYYYYVY